MPFKIGPLELLLLTVVVVVIIAWIVSAVNRKQKIGGPLEIARQRYARGEITLAQLEEIKKNIS